MKKSTRELRKRWIKGPCPIRPRNDYVAMVRLEEEERTKSGLVLSRKAGSARHAMGEDDTKSRETIGQVVAIGPGKFNATTGQRVTVDGIKVGDYITATMAFGGTAIMNFEDSGADVCIVSEEGVTAVVQIIELEEAISN